MRMRVKRRWAWPDAQAGFWVLIELLIVAIIIAVAVSYYLTSQRMVGAVSGGDPSGYDATTVPGVATERAKRIQCQNNLQQLRSVIETSTKDGMHTLNSSLLDLERDKRISTETAIATSNDVRGIMRDIQISRAARGRKRRH